ncbi:MAG: acyl-CoA dehydrogenase family protein [Thermogemmatispora sp.]|uniref:acyl-CoA dehydrogenase family protein n=1 Tax=Thermogemmatispora sp. TaxID=1968838 RepID=UPI002638C6EC|nr:acyl-CoA dehydrogenase family protein [Thermogemmatispora sp.]MBX5456122.1 acyl-CoA dehydrogenase family protein [Thermogemmatispora sp.]
MIDFTLSKAQQAARDYAHQVALEEMRPLSLECDRTEEIPESFFWNMQRRYWGGAAAQARAYGQDEGVKQENLLSVISQEEMAWGDAALATAIPGPGLAAPPILSQGTPEQQARFLSIYMDGQLHWGALALTEPGIGSDVAGMSTTAVLDGDEWVINGHKHYITNGARADLIVTFATIDKRLGREGIRPFVVPKGTPGLIVGRIEKKMGLRASQTAELIFENCRIPKENLLAGRGEKKEGFKAAMGTLDATRPMVGALAVGIARAAYEAACEWLREELPAGYPPHKRRAWEEELKELGQEIEMARFLVWRAAWMADRRIPNSKEASMSKAYAGALVMKATATAVRITAPGEESERKLLIQKWFRDAKVFDIFEGTAQIQRLVIARRLFPNIDIP